LFHQYYFRSKERNFFHVKMAANVYFPYKFINDVVGLTDAQLVTQLNTDLSGNSFAQGFIGILMKYRNPNFDLSTYQTAINVVVDYCIEFLILRYRKVFDFVSLVKLFVKVLSLTNLKYLYTIIAYLVAQNIIFKSTDDYDLILSTTNSYLALSSSSVPEETIVLNSNLIPVIQPLVFTSDSIVNFLTTTLENTSQDPVTVSIVGGSFILFSQQTYQLSTDESLLSLDAICNINLVFFSANLAAFLYTANILSILQ
jgi:hypothetical protein